MDFEKIARIQKVAHLMIAAANRRSDHRASAEVRRVGDGAEVRLVWQPGKMPEDDPLLPLGTIMDELAMELRLEHNKVGDPIFRTEEPTFTGGDRPEYLMRVILHQPGEDRI